jgi:hypothetical protein
MGPGSHLRRQAKNSWSPRLLQLASRSSICFFKQIRRNRPQGPVIRSARGESDENRGLVQSGHPSVSSLFISAGTRERQDLRMLLQDHAFRDGEGRVQPGRTGPHKA